MEQKKLTGYPSIDKPWLKYYSEDERNLKIPEGTMYDNLFACNSKFPEDIALEYYGHTYSYAELFRLIDKCCKNLTAIGIKKGDIVTIQAIPLPQVIVLIYALTRIGACGNMLYPDAKAKEVVHSMKKTDSQILIVVDKILSLYETDLPDSFAHTIILLNVSEEMSLFPRILARKKAMYKPQKRGLNTIPWTEFINGAGKPYRDNHDGTIPAFMLRTGGTTGIPKETVLSSRNFNAITEAAYRAHICNKWERQRTDIMLLPPFIAFGIGSGIHDALCFGLRTIITLDISPAAVSKLFLKYKPSYIIAGTVQIEHLMSDFQEQKVDLSYIQMLSIGGESMNQSYETNLHSFLLNHNCRILPLKGYGLTETCATATMETIDANALGSVGIPFALCNMKIVDPDTGKELPYNTAGEVCLSSPGIMQGYYKNTQATDEVIEIIDGERWLHTGDIGIISEDGLLTLTGRVKRIITCREGNIYHKVFPLLIEDALAKIGGVHEISIVGRTDQTAGNVPVAFVVPENEESFEQVKKELEAYCSTSLEKYERPVDYIYMKALPRTLIGKVNYRALEERAAKEA